ncbi:hypothetical protein HMF7854_10435 [Sphingomonas ginkgonis]|uniref:asparagine synthase (glutamine-hydrolyzing) n=1 Tax=Sphingomonas ginkgonis TaxID=2315330 RepID=A0A3R9WQT2_9SPHN|nr:asparagine synthase-related protein [Sphingomonas ginkgonis]RST31207.1 hypothetical protein HMF7854_10435 [Sphingomonas ginkgonis]
MNHGSGWFVAAGPDACGIVQASLPDYPTGQFLFFRVADPSMVSERHGVTVLVDGRIDNRRELLHALGLAADLTNAGLVLSAWLCWGEQTIERLHGDFAIVVHDLGRHSLFLARDIFGQRSLFYRLFGDGLVVGPSSAELAKLVGSCEPDILHLLREEILEADEGDSTNYREVRRVRPGEILRWNGAVSATRYWRPRLDPLPIDDGEATEEYRSLLDQAVAARLPRGGTVACHLSSGFDSAAVVATASRLAGSGRVRAFTSAPWPGDFTVPKDRVADEAPIARELSAELGIAHRTIRDNESPLTLWRRYSGVFEMPIRKPFNTAWWTAIAQQAREGGSSVLLTGEMGNLTLNFGGPHVLANYLSSRRYLVWLRESLLALRRPEFSWKGVAFNSVAPFLPSALRQRLTGDNLGAVTFLRREHWERAGISPDYNSSPESRLDYFRLLDWGLHRNSTRTLFGLDERDAMADRRIAEFALRLPPEQFFRNGQARPLAKRALADRLPPYILDAKTRGLQSADWALRLDRAAASEALEEISASHAAVELFDFEAMRQALNNWPVADWNRLDIVMRYRVAFVSALATGYFLLSLEGRL